MTVITHKAITFDELLERLRFNASATHNSQLTTHNFISVCIDSRLVRKGDVFVAIPGTNNDGHDFIDQAVANGAKYVVCERTPVANKTQGEDYQIITVGSCAQAAGLLAQAAKGSPASKLINLAVTGTNGKTTVAFLVRSCIQAAGKKCGLIGTIVYDTGLSCSPAPLTTPDCLSLADAQQQMLEAGARYMVIEASSHALYQDRLAGIDFRAAAFTNCTGDHLDFHKTKEAYLAAKTRLFSGLSRDAMAVLNKQSPEAQFIAGQTKARILWFAIDEPADITAHIESMDIDRTVFVLEYRGQRQKVETALLGWYNVSNHLAAAGLCIAAGLDLETIVRGLAALQGVPGRLEKLCRVGFSPPSPSKENGGASPTLLIDYAHTDDALKNVLTTLKPLCNGRLIVVFGCGGDRDRTKRPRMAQVTEQLADVVIVTSDNPRTEKPEDIINEIVAGFSRTTHDARRNTRVIESDRKKAIQLAIETARTGDIVLIAGKGHETYQIIGCQKFHFSDSEVAAERLARATEQSIATSQSNMRKP
jgi:UDP-N-acetylmuramoyl-L-alanyl-D-glutamate--2,6-diaminopimelate ligase